MAGLNFSITIDDRDVRQALNSLIERGGSLEPVLHEIGFYLVEVHQARFSAQVGADGRPWQPLNKKYQARKKHHQDMILVLNEYLAEYFFYEATDTEVTVGTKIKYAALHHFGFAGSEQVSAHTRRSKKTGKTSQVSAHTRQMNMPARPFMGVAEGDEEILNSIADYLMQRG